MQDQGLPSQECEQIQTHIVKLTPCLSTMHWSTSWRKQAPKPLATRPLSCKDLVTGNTALVKNSLCGYLRPKYYSFMDKKSWSQIARRTLGKITLEGFKARLDTACSNQIYGRCPCPWRGVEQDRFQGPFRPKPPCDSVIRGGI